MRPSLNRTGSSKTTVWPGRGLAAKLFGGRRLPRRGSCGARISTTPNVGQPVLGDHACLFGGDLAELTDGRFTAFIVGGGVGDHKRLSARRHNFQQKTRDRGVTDFVNVVRGQRGGRNGFGELDFRHLKPPFRA